MAGQTFFERVKSAYHSFLGEQEEKQKSELGPLVGPAFREVPPEGTPQKLMDEGIKGWVYACISVIADDISANPFFIFKRKGDDWTPIDSHAIMDLINQPNPYQTKEEFMWLTSGYLMAVGEALWILNTPKNPTEMVLYNPTRVTPKFGDSKRLESYKILLTDGSTQTIPAEQCIFLKLPNFRNPFRGTGVMEYITKSIDIDNFVQDYIKVYFYNSAMPKGILETDAEIDEDTGKRILKAFESKHRGIKNAHRTSLLDQGLKYKVIENNFQQLQMGETDVRTMSRILGAFKVPKSVLGLTEEVNRANAEAAAVTFSKRAVLPKLRFIEAQVNMHLVSKFSEGMNLFFEFENPVLEDALTKATIREINIRSGVRTADEYRAEDGLEPLSMDDQNEPDPSLEETGKQMRTLLQKAINQRINRKKRLSNVEKKILAVEAVIYDEAKRIVEKKYAVKIEKGPYPDEEIELYHKKKVENSDKIESDFADRILQNKARQKKALLAQLSGKRRKKATDLTLEFDEKKEAEILAALSVPYMERSLLAQAALSAALLNIDNTLDTQDNRVRAFMKKWSVKLGKSNAETTADGITNILRQWGEDEEASIADLKKSLSDFLDDNTKAETIARTEVSRAAGYAQETVYKDAGAVGKKWATAIDERVCEFCDEMDGKIVEISETFLDKGDTLTGGEGGKLPMDYGSVVSAPLHPNCRCDLIPVFEDSKSGDFSFKKFQKKLVELDTKAKEVEKEKAELQKKEADLKKKAEEHEKKVEEEIQALEELKDDESKAEKTSGEEEGK